MWFENESENDVGDMMGDFEDLEKDTDLDI
jgi:hypothetical protein